MQTQWKPYNVDCVNDFLDMTPNALQTISKKDSKQKFPCRKVSDIIKINV